MQRTMSKTKGLAKILRDNGLTQEQMQSEWNRVVEASEEGCGGVASVFVRGGYNWDNLPPHLITQVPGLADRMRQNKVRKEAEEAAEEARKQAERDARKYYLDHVEEVLVAKLDRGEELSNQEIEDFLEHVSHYDEEVGENRRWNRSVTTYLKAKDGRFFRIDWEQGLTESQEDSYWNQPVEVSLHEEEKTIVVIQRTWTEVASGKQECSSFIPSGQ